MTWQKWQLANWQQQQKHNKPVFSYGTNTRAIQPNQNCCHVMMENRNDAYISLASDTHTHFHTLDLGNDETLFLFQPEQ